MDLKDILSISGQKGLFKLITQSRNGIIVESLENKKRMNAFASVKINALKDIALFTDEKEIPLAEIFKKIYEKEEGGKTIQHKVSDEELKNYFAEILPNYDRARVYVSDIKKVVNWYNILHELDMLKFDEQQKEGEKEKN